MRKTDRKESRQFFMSVEGINCEKMYFEHLSRLINESDRNKYNLKLTPKVTSPYEYAKRNAYKPAESGKNKKLLPYLHIQDIEDYYHSDQLNRFHGIIDEMRKAEKTFKIEYKLGYSNYTFELWMLLHVANMKHAIANRYAYLEPINRYFKRKFKSLDDFKKANEFQRILDEFVTLDSVFCAIKRAKTIVQENERDRKKKENYKGFEFYRDNPDLSVHTIVELIFQTCEVAES